MQQDPVVSQVKLIAEPWDIGDGGYQVGGFPPLWTEWNGKYRDTVRDYWRGEPATLAEFASRLVGSSDLYEHSGRKPIASINFVTAHDGFTLADLVSYNQKHNEKNLEGGNDGEDHNRSWNCGAEGPTDDKSVLKLRRQQQRNLLATLLLSQGVPMISHGDEFGRTQHGNNNTYCQNNELSWMDWKLELPAQELLLFVRKLIALRHGHPVLRRRRFFSGDASHGGESDMGDIAWYTIDGVKMQSINWQSGHARSFMVFLNGDAIGEPDALGQPVVGDSFLMMFNAWSKSLHANIPLELSGQWVCELNTAADSSLQSSAPTKPDIDELTQAGKLLLEGRSLQVLRRENKRKTPTLRRPPPL